MITLFQQYSLSDFLTVAVLLAVATKGLISFFDFMNDKFKNIFNLKHSKISEKEELERRLQHGSQVMKTLTQGQQENDKLLKELSEKIDMLIESDKDDIKSYITREHHYFCYQLGWIDDFSLDCCERRFKHYREQGGNSFIENFMEDLRKLPKAEAATRKQ